MLMNCIFNQINDAFHNYLSLYIGVTRVTIVMLLPYLHHTMSLQLSFWHMWMCAAKFLFMVPCMVSIANTSVNIKMSCRIMHCALRRPFYGAPKMAGALDCNAPQANLGNVKVGFCFKHNCFSKTRSKEACEVRYSTQWKVKTYVNINTNTKWKVKAYVNINTSTKWKVKAYVNINTSTRCMTLRLII